MFSQIISLFDRLLRRYTPDPFVIAALLTAVVFVAGTIATPHSMSEISRFWGDGFWQLISFTLQMVMILLGGYIVAVSKPVQKMLGGVASIAKTPGQAVVVCTLVSFAICWLNWGFGLVASAFVCRAVYKKVPTANYRLLVASAYSGFLVWHAGMSGSIPLVVSTKGNFSEEMIGRLIPISDTIFAPMNLVALLGLLIILPSLNWLMGKFSNNNEPLEIENNENGIPDFDPKTPAEKFENSPIIPLLLVAIAGLYLFGSIGAGTFHFDLNCINFLLLSFGLLLHLNTRRFLFAAGEGAKKVWPILVQYPLYAGIMGVMRDSGLAADISNLFVSISNETTFPLLTFYSAGIINFFVPSGGGQWAVQAPIVIEAAQQLGVSLEKSIMAVAWGDAWTNMAQPFWAVPLLSIAGLKIRDIIGFCLMILVVSGIWLSIVFLTL